MSSVVLGKRTVAQFLDIEAEASGSDEDEEEDEDEENRLGKSVHLYFCLSAYTICGR